VKRMTDRQPPLTEEKIKALLAEALKVRKNAYAPYSHYKVGAAVLTGSGRIFTGCNIENASYGATICAERVAASSALAAGERELTALAVVSDSRIPGPPCGICRQFLIEFAPGLPIFMYNLQGEFRKGNLDSFIPAAFNGTFLEYREGNRNG